MTTIVARATPAGFGGIGIVRISGSNAYQIACKICKKDKLIPNTAHYSNFYQTNNNNLLDAGICLYFKAPHSFTGEDVVEFQGHGSPKIIDLIILEILKFDAVLALPGEFSKRAFLNNKIDLIQAEAIADLIHAQTTTAASYAMRSLSGDFSKRVNDILKELVNLRIYVEAAIDFADEEIDFLNDQTIKSKLKIIANKFTNIMAQTRQGLIQNEGVNIVIAGLPNAGKSTLINTLAGKDIAITNSKAGTTRDIIKADIIIDDILCHITDTAGLHQTTEEVEQEGIRRARDEIINADCIIKLVDATKSDALDKLNSQLEFLTTKDKKVITVFNKLDITKKPASGINISAKEKLGILELKEAIKSAVGYIPQEGLFMANRRHWQQLLIAQEAINNASKINSLDILAEELRCAQLAFNEITGEFSSDDLLGKIFANFCIGK